VTVRAINRAERLVSRLLVRRWYDFDRRPPRPLAMLWGFLLRLRGRRP
jgi:hypothetical protein